MCNPRVLSYMASYDVFLATSARPRVEGIVTFSFDEAHRAILRPQLDAVRSVYDAVCAPHQAPAGWTGAVFASVVSTDTAGPASCCRHAIQRNLNPRVWT